MLADLQGVLLSPWALGLLGLCIGSFLNVVIHRLPQMMERAWKIEAAEILGAPAPDLPELSLSRPASRCPQCGHRIRWFENIPLVSWLVLRGRCSACKTPISARYPIVEGAIAALFAVAASAFGSQATTLVWCIALALLLCMALIDLDTTLLPDSLTFPLIGLGLLAALCGWSRVSLDSSVIGLLAGYSSLWLLAKGYGLIRGVQGMAEGDFKMLAGLGALLGWQLLPAVVLLASVVGAVVGVAMILFRGHDRTVPIPFGPYLAGGGIAAIFFGNALTSLYFPTY